MAARACVQLRAAVFSAKNWPQRNNARWGPLVTRLEGSCLFPGLTGKRGKPRQLNGVCHSRGARSLNAACSLRSGKNVEIQSLSRQKQQTARPARLGRSNARQAASATFLTISFLSLRTFGESLSSLVFNSQLSSPPTCSTERRPWVDTRSLTLVPSASEISVTFCRLGRNVRFVLLLAWETLLPTCRPLPVSSQTRDMVLILIVRVRTA